jgi:hypothetical protein
MMPAARYEERDMEDNSNLRFAELWESFKQLHETTNGLEVSSGRFVLMPPATVRLSGFRARLARSADGPSVVLIADTAAVVTELHKAGEPASQARKHLSSIDLSQGYVCDGESMKHASVLARALLDRMEALLDPSPNPRLVSAQNRAGQQPVGHRKESSLER